MYIKIKAKAGANKNSLVKVKDDTFEVSVKEPPENNLANLRIIKLLSEHFSVSTKAIHIVRGHSRPSKIIAIDLGTGK